MLKVGRRYDIMLYTVVISMKNSNALIAMAQVAQNAKNPYEAFANTSSIVSFPMFPTQWNYSS